MLLAYKDILHKLEEIERKYADQDQKIMLIFEYLKQLEASRQLELEPDRKPIGYKTHVNS